MAHNTRTRVNLAAWANGTAITQDELDKLDGYAYSAVNGDAGGTWAPAAAIVFGGAGLELASAPLVLSGTASLSVAGAATFTGSFSATGASLTIGNNSTSTLALRAVTTATKLVVCQDAFVAQGAVTLGISDANALTVNATSTFNSEVTVNQEVVVNSNVELGSSPSHTLQVNSLATFYNTVDFDEETAFNAALIAHNNVIVGDSATQTLEVNAEATFNAVENHNANVAFNANVNLGNTKSDIIDLNGRLVVDVELVGLGVSNSRDGDCADRIIITGTPGIVTGISFTSTNAVDGLVKRISKQGGSDNVSIVDAGTATTLASLNSVGDTCEICYKTGRWWKS